MKQALVLGGSGFIGTALTKRLQSENYLVTVIDQIRQPLSDSSPDKFVIWDLRQGLPPGLGDFHEVYQLACDMGGAGWIFTGEHDADVIANNVLINAQAARYFARTGSADRILYTSSSCVYNDAWASMKAKSEGYRLREADAYPSLPSNSYGWEKLFSEQLWQAHARNYGLNVCITRFSTIYGPGSAYDNGREKAVAALCRKVLAARHGESVEVWGDGQQVRPLVYIDDLLEGMTRLIRHPTFRGPVNIANDEYTTCDEIAREAVRLSNKRLEIRHVPGPIGKQVLDMDTSVAKRELGWSASTAFVVGLERTFEWIGQKMGAKGGLVL